MSVAAKSDETLRTTSTKLLSSLAGAALLLAAAGSASAQDARIPWGDLDLGTGRGAATLDSRIEAAADRLCRNARRPGSLISDRQFCRAATARELACP